MSLEFLAISRPVLLSGLELLADESDDVSWCDVLISRSRLEEDTTDTRLQCISCDEVTVHLYALFLSAAQLDQQQHRRMPSSLNSSSPRADAVTEESVAPLSERSLSPSTLL